MIRKMAVLLCAAVAITNTFAQDAAEDDYDSAGSARELVFTASRAKEEAAKASARITVITADDIAKSGAENVVQVLETVPGVQFKGGMAGAGSETINMRGFGENSHGRVLVLLDGKRLNSPDMSGINWNTVSLAEIERIEVLDGSASVQYGNSAVGGVVNIITKKSGKQRTAISLSLGSFWQNNAAISHFQPFSFGAFSVSANHTGTEGYRKRQEAQVTNLSAAGTFNIGEKLSIGVDGGFSDLTYQLPGGLKKTEFEDDPTKSLQSFYDPDNSYAESRIFNGDDTVYIKDYSAGLSFDFTPIDSLALALPFSFHGKQYKSDMTSWVSFSNRNTNSFEARPQAAFNINISDMPLRILGGVDVYYTKLDVETYNDKARENKPAGNAGSFWISEMTAGPYLTMRFEPLSILSINAGLRYDSAFINADSENNLADGDKVNGALVYEAGINTRPIKNLKIYAKFATLFRYPFIDEQAQAALYEKFNGDLDPEKGFNAEGGAAFSISEIAVLNANFFFMRLEDEIAYLGAPINKNVNMDKTQRLGINANAGLTPIKYISLDASYSFVDASFISGDNKDKKIPLVPAHKVNAALSFNLPFGISFGPDIEWTSMRYAGGDFSNEHSEFAVDDIFLLGAKIRYVFDKDDKNFALQITGRNLTNLKYATNVIWDSYSGEAAYYPNDGLSISVQAQYRF